MSEAKKAKNGEKILKFKVAESITPEKDVVRVPERPNDYEKISLQMISRILLFVAVFGGLFAFLPLENISAVFLKSTIIFGSIFTAIALFGLHILRKNEVLLPNNALTYSVFLLPLVYLISSIFSKVKSMSLIGYGFEIGTFSFMFAMALLVLLATLLFRKKKHIVWYQFLLVAFALVLFVIQIIHIFFPNALGLTSVLPSKLSTLVGNINDFGIYFGAIALLSLSVIEFSLWGKIGKIIAGVSLAISIIALAISGFSYLWLVIGLFALFIFVSLFSFSTFFSAEVKGNKLSYTSLAVVVISAIFVIFGGSIGSVLRTQFGIVNNFETYPPTFQSTLPVISSVMKEGVRNIIVGVGPNRFVSEWLKNKPDATNYEASWNVDYNYGNSIFLTSIVTTGALGALAWILVFIVLIYMGVKYVFFHPKSGMIGYLSFSTFLVAVYLWITLLIHVPSPGILTLVFFTTGMFISSLYAGNIISEKKYLFASSPAKSFLIVLLTVVVIIGAVALDYLVFSKFYASYTYKVGLNYAKNGQFTEGRSFMNKAVSFGGSDIYHRGLSELYMAELRSRESELTKNPSQSQLQISQNLTKNSAESAQRAIIADRTNYQNYLTFGSIYRLFVSSNSLSTYDIAKQAYLNASKLAPKNPAIYLSLAGLENQKGDALSAEEYVRKSLTLKPNYTQARYEWAQIQIANNNISGAIATLEEAMAIAPNDAGVRFHLGLLRFEKRQYALAVENFEGALGLIPEHANARYYLALSYGKLGRFDDALRELLVIEKTNPNNELLKTAISEIRDNQDIPEEILDPEDDLPIEEEN